MLVEIPTVVSGWIQSMLPVVNGGSDLDAAFAQVHPGFIRLSRGPAVKFEPGLLI